MKKVFLFLLLLFAAPLEAQISVALAPSVHPQFLTTTGQPLSGGFIFTYQAGTSIRQDTYTDNTGVIINAWPIPLDATGAPSNGSTQTGIWLANLSYKICAYNAASVQQWCTDNVSAYQILNGVQNIIFGSVTSDPSGMAGEIGYRSDLGCFRGYTTFWDCFVTYTGIQTLTNKTLVSPILTGSVVNAPLVTPSVNGVTETGQPSTYLTLANAIVTGTTINTLTKMNGATAVISSAGDTGGAVGITTAGAGTTGSATIQQNGFGSCVFDNATTAGDYVQISPTIAGNCHDVGAVPPSTGIVGRVTVTTGSPSTDGIIISIVPSLISGSTSGCTNFAPITVVNNNAAQNLMSCTLSANVLVQGSELVVDFQGVNNTASVMTISFNVNLGGGTPCLLVTPSTGVSTNQPWHATGKLFVLTSGAGGTANWSCQYASSSSGGAIFGPNGVVGTPTISLNTTIPNVIQITVQMSVANAGNSVVEQGLKAVIY
jgi:hypothetical protein